MIVAPNSPNARAKASSVPAQTPRRASGSVIVKKTRHSPAPSVRAICSKPGFTSSKAVRAARTNNGSDITASAITTARHVNTTSNPKRSCNQCPSGPRLPNSFYSTNPVSTGGRTKGSVTSVSSNDLPRHPGRAKHQANAKPNGAMTTVLSSAIRTVKPTNCQSSRFTEQIVANNSLESEGTRFFSLVKTIAAVWLAG